MKKFSFILAGILLALVVNVQAQTNLYTNDFEAYTVGSKFAQQAGNPWTTWSLAPGGTEDPVVSSVHAHSGTKSVQIADANDLVYKFNNRTTGRYMIEWYMYVPAGKLGYFNFLSYFSGANSLWGLQAYVSHDSLIVDADGAAKGLSTNFTHDTWHQMQLFVDLDDDFATLYLSGAEVISYKWSRGAFGTDNSLKLDGIDFYGWNNGITGAASYFLDDINIDSVAAPVAPTALSATINGANIDVVWTAPNPAPDMYKLSCNGSIVYSNTGLTYTNVGPWPGTYRYIVRAGYNGQGYSHASNMDSATIAGGVTRDLVLMESGTGLWCQYCPGAAMGLDDLINVNHKNAVAIEYHSGDSLEILAGAFRVSTYYAMTGFPTVVADGKLTNVGGSHTVSSYPTLLNMYNQRIDVPSHHMLNVSIVETSPTNYQATISIQQTFQAITSGIKLHTALTETNLPIAWQGQTHADFVCRAMYPDENGTDLDFPVQNPQTVIIDFSTGSHVKNNCAFVAFIQYDALKEVTQAVRVDMSSVLGTDEIQGKNVSIYPNPASEYIMALTNGKGLIEIFDMAGKLISSTVLTQNTQVIDVRGLAKGLYFVKVNNGENTFVEKLVKE